MRKVIKLCVLLFVLNGCNTKISEGVYQEDLARWKNENGEFPIEYYQFAKNKKFKYGIIFCFLNENGYGKYRIKGNKLNLKFKRQKFSSYQITEVSSKQDSNFIEIKLIKLPKNLKHGEINLGVYYSEFDAHLYSLKYGEPLRILNSEIIYKLEILEYEIEIPSRALNKNVNLKIEIQLVDNDTNSFTISDSIIVKDFSILNDSTLQINKMKFFKIARNDIWN